MFNLIAKKVTCRLVATNTIKIEDEEIYIYGLEQFLERLLEWLMIILMGLMVNKVLQTIIFLISFTSLRKYAGGYHAKTKMRCYILTVCVNIIVLCIMKYIKVNIWMCISTLVVSCVVIFWLAPIGAENKPLEQDEIMTYGMRTRGIMCIQVMMIIILIMFKKYSIAMCIGLAMSIVTFSLVAGKVSLGNEKKNCK